MITECIHMKLSPEKQKLLKKETTAIKKLDLHPNTEKIIKDAALNFHGQLPALEGAIGALYAGQIYGWRVLRVAHGSTTYNKYEDILGVKFKDVCEGESVLGHRSWGLRLTKSLKSFWKVATGKVKTGGKSLMIDDGTEEPVLPK